MNISTKDIQEYIDYNYCKESNNIKEIEKIYTVYE